MPENLRVSCLESEMFPFTCYGSDQKRVFLNLMQCGSVMSLLDKKLRSFLISLSKATNLSKVYTNHSERATGASILSKCMYGPSQVMAVTGHKSVQRLSVYQRVSDAKIIQMGESISENLAPTSSLPTLPSTKRHANSLSSSTVGETQIMECDLTGWQID